MKTKLLILTLAIVFLIGCGHKCQGPQLKSGSQTQQVAIDVTASTIGYYVGKNNLSHVPLWNKWINSLLELEQGDTVLSYENLLAKGFDLVVDEPFLEMQLKKLIRLLEFPELQPPNMPFLTGPYMEMVRLVLGGFQEGLEAAQAEANG